MSKYEGCLNKSVSIGKTKTAISSNTTTAGNTIDVRGYNKVTFAIIGEAYTDGTYTPLISESNDSGMSGENAVADAELVSFGTGAPEANAALTSATTKTISYTGIKDYVTCDIVSTGVTSGATVTVIAILEDPIVMPVGA